MATMEKANIDWSNLGFGYYKPIKDMFQISNGNGMKVLLTGMKILY